jgi:hypothetical protein
MTIVRTGEILSATVHVAVAAVGVAVAGVVFAARGWGSGMEWRDGGQTTGVPVGSCTGEGD